MLTVKLQDDNFVKWSYQFQSILRGYDLFNYFTGESPCSPRFVIDTETCVTKEVIVAYKNWVKKDLALLSLLIVTLSDDVMEYVIGCKTSQKSRYVPILIQLPVLEDNGLVYTSNSSSTQDTQHSLVHTNAEQYISEIGNSSSSSLSHSTTFETPDHYHSTPTSVSSPLLHVHHSSQLEVLFPISS
ncbi:hypothetical protein ACFX2J_008730 [Malus domestica]